MEKKTNKPKLEIFKFLRKAVLSQGFFEIFIETLEQKSEKVRKYVFQMEKKTNKAKLEIFKFLRKSALSQGYSL